MSHILVNKKIEDSEECIRCVYNPIMIDSRHKLKREAFLPPRDKKDVSLLRLIYTNLDFCLQHGSRIRMNGQSFCALASVTSNVVHGLNQMDTSNLFPGSSTDKKTIATIKYGPIADNAYVDDSIDVYTDDSKIELPMHADLLYNDCLHNGEVRTRLRFYANELIKRVKYAINENVHNQPWEGESVFDSYNV